MFTSPFDARRPLASRRQLLSRRKQQTRFRQLLTEQLEDRRLLSLADLLPTTVTDDNDSLGSTDLSTILWQGEERTVHTGHWIVGMDGLSANPAGATEHRCSDVRRNTRPARPSRRCAAWAARGFVLIETAPTVSYEQLQTSLSSLPGFRYVEPDFVITLDSTPPNDLGFRELYGLNNTGQTGGTADADIDAD